MSKSNKNNATVEVELKDLELPELTEVCETLGVAVEQEDTKEILLAKIETKKLENIREQAISLEVGFGDEDTFDVIAERIATKEREIEDAKNFTGIRIKCLNGFGYKNGIYEAGKEYDVNFDKADLKSLGKGDFEIIK